MSRMHYLYHIENLVNGTLYLGKTMDRKDKNARWNEHKGDARRGRTKMPIHSAIRKYGDKNFVFTLMEAYDTQEEALLAEVYWLALLRSQGVRLYNITNGGEGISFKRGPRTPEHTAQLKCFPKDHIPWNKNQEMSSEFRKKVSDNIPNRKISNIQREEIKKLWSAGKYKQWEIGKMFGVSQNVISRIVNNKTSWVARGRKNPKKTRS